jgi:hypothetical protein
MRLIVTLLTLFVLAQLLGIYTGIVVLLDFPKNPFVSSLVVTTDAEEPSNALFFILYIVLGAVLMVLMIRLFGIYPVIFRAMEFMLIATASSIVFYAFLRIFTGFEISTLAAVAMGIAFAGIKIFVPDLKNAAAVLCSAYPLA